MSEIIFSVRESPEGGFEAEALGASIFTDGEDMEMLLANVKEAVSAHFEEAEMPKVIRLHFLKEIVIAA
ncbi:MAG: hypothetical protein J5I62_09640 [Flavobacteriales bacterium]|jgi:hypothetical protein|nr:hypothetical protein [Flavobacteriales bacterium]MEB2342395.1 2-oxoisovalerate dehydrogenase [Flavobacteriia bacterium]